MAFLYTNNKKYLQQEDQKKTKKTKEKAIEIEEEEEHLKPRPKWRDRIRIIGPDDEDKDATAKETSKLVEINQQVATQTALEEKNQELEKAVLDMANRAAGEKSKTNKKKRKAEEIKSTGNNNKKGNVSKKANDSDEEDDGIDYTLEENWTIKCFSRHEKIKKKNGVEEYQLIAIWKGYKKGDPRRTTKEPLDSAYMHWKKQLQEYCVRNKMMAQVCKAKKYSFDD